MIELQTLSNEADVMDRLRASGTHVAHLKLQIANLQRELEEEVTTVAELYRQYGSNNQSLAETASDILASSSICNHIWSDPINGKRKCVHCGTFKPDKRTELNPIKNLNIGVNLSYRHSKKLLRCNHCSFTTDNIQVMFLHAVKDHDISADDVKKADVYSTISAEDARERAYASIVETAIKKGVHTDDSTPQNPKYVTSIQNLPKKVVEKIEQGFANYNSQTKVKKTKKAKTA
jgi:hypothetical protein